MLSGAVVAPSFLTFNLVSTSPHLACVTHPIFPFFDINLTCTLPLMGQFSSSTAPGKMKPTSKLFGNEKYADSLVECDGKLIFSHKAIVCTRSDVLAREFDDEMQASATKAFGPGIVLTCQQGTDGKPIVNTLFDYYTLMRMLRFIYDGDYSVDAASLQPETVNGAVNGAVNAPSKGQDGMRTKPHRRGSLESARSRSGSPRWRLRRVREKVAVTNVMTAHVLVYAAAEHYQLPDLKVLSLTKFKEAKEELRIDGFFNLAKAVYRYTAPADDPLRQEFVKILLADYSGRLSAEDFTDAFAADPDLHEFAVAVTAALIKKSTESAGKDKAATEAQASASKHLLSTLNQTNEALVKSTERIKALESELAAAKIENKEVGAKASSCASELQNGAATIRALQSDLEKAKAGRNKAENRVKVLERGNSKLEKAIKDVEESMGSCTDRLDITQSHLDVANNEVRAKTADAGKYYDLYKKAEAALQREKDRSARIRSEQDSKIAVEMARADKGVMLLKSVKGLVNGTKDCRHCGEALQWWLEIDDRLPIQPKEEPKLLQLACACGTRKRRPHVDRPLINWERVVGAERTRL